MFSLDNLLLIRHDDFNLIFIHKDYKTQIFKYYTYVQCYNYNIYLRTCMARKSRSASF